MNDQLVTDLARASFQYKLNIGSKISGTISLAELGQELFARDVATQFQQRYAVPKLRYAGSLAFQRAAHRIVGINIASWMLHGEVLVCEPDATRVHMTDGVTSALRLPSITPISTDAHGATQHVLEVMEPIVNSFHMATGVGVANLMGNIAATIGGAVRNVSRKFPIRDAAAQGSELLGAHPVLKNLGWFEHLHENEISATVFYRNSCCHWHTTGEERCDWCTHRGSSRRMDFYQQLRALS